MTILLCAAWLAVLPQSIGRFGNTFPLPNAVIPRSAITMADLSWVGEFRVPSGGSASSLAGSANTDATGFAIRYVSPVDSNCQDQRRFLFPLYDGAYFVAATAISTANPAVVTTSSAHNLVTGQTVSITFSNSSPVADGTYTVTVSDATHFSIPFNLVGGTAATTAAVGPSPRTYGDLVEYCQPAGSTPYTGTDPTLSPALHETRRWPAGAWDSAMGIAGDTSSGNVIGGLMWDSTNSVLWIAHYGYYYGNNMPTYSAVQLLDTANSTLGGDYVNVGTQYGPWFYRSNVAGPTHLEWKGINQGMSPIPSDQQASFGSRDTILCGMVGAVGGTGHLGLGVRAAAKPALSLAANSVMFPTDNSGIGLRLADYTDDGTNPFSPFVNMRRDNTYTLSPSFGDHIFPGGGLWTPDSVSNPTLPGYWAMSMDQSSGCQWVETSDREGIVSFGRQVGSSVHANSYIAYGFSSLSNTFKTLAGITESGTTVTANVPKHQMQSGDTMTIGCVTPSGYNGTFTITVTDGDHFTYTAASSGMGAGSYTSSGTTTTTDGGVIACSNFAGMESFGWDTALTPDITDPADGPHNYQNSYVGQTYDGVIRVLNPATLRSVAQGASPYNDNVNWTVIGSWYRSPPTGWHIPPYYIKASGGANDSRIDQFSTAANSLQWDSTVNQLVWLHIGSNANAFTTASLTPTIQIIHVN